MRDAVVEFQNFNRAFARRNPELLRLKVARMAASPFAFFRGTFHLFARDSLDHLCELPSLEIRPELELDVVGDIHSENFGTFDGGDGCVHYDVNDFDETTHGRFDFDVRRQAASVILACQERGDSLADATAASVAFLSHYTDTVTRLLTRGRNLDHDVSEKERLRLCRGGPPGADGSGGQTAGLHRQTDEVRQGTAHSGAFGPLLQPARRRASAGAATPGGLPQAQAGAADAELLRAGGRLRPSVRYRQHGPAALCRAGRRQGQQGRPQPAL